MTDLLTIVGNRPQFVKCAAVSVKLRQQYHEFLVHTGQHHDRLLSDVFFSELGIPEPDCQLSVEGGSNTSQLARMLAAIEPVIAEQSPDLVMVYGDTNSTLAGALAAVQAGVPCVHVEAGMRSFDRSMPEEVNRVICDSICSVLLAPSSAAAANLKRESVFGEVVVTGDVMGDAVQLFRPLAEERSDAVERFKMTAGEFIFFTAHRAGNVDDAVKLEAIVEILEAVPMPVVFPVHPRTRVRLQEFGLHDRLGRIANLKISPPLGYLDTLRLVGAARCVVTDSGGLQKEAVWLGTPCVTLRDTTEWTETVAAGWNTLVGTDVERAVAAVSAPCPPGSPPQLYGGGSAADAVVAALRSHISAEAHR